MAFLKPLVSGYYIWKYIPSVPAAAISAIIFIIITGAHGWRMSKTRLWFCLPIVIGGLSKLFFPNNKSLLSSSL
jgi:Na+/citrate or Na+/malate symporter